MEKLDTSCWKDEKKFRKETQNWSFMVSCSFFSRDKVIGFARDTKTCKLRHHIASQAKKKKRKL